MNLSENVYFVNEKPHSREWGYEGMELLDDEVALGDLSTSEREQKVGDGDFDFHFLFVRRWIEKMDDLDAPRAYGAFLDRFVDADVRVVRVVGEDVSEEISNRMHVAVVREERGIGSRVGMRSNRQDVLDRAFAAIHHAVMNVCFRNVVRCTQLTEHRE